KEEVREMLRREDLGRLTEEIAGAYKERPTRISAITARISGIKEETANLLGGLHKALVEVNPRLRVELAKVSTGLRKMSSKRKKQAQAEMRQTQAKIRKIQAEIRQMKANFSQMQDEFHQYQAETNTAWRNYLSRHHGENKGRNGNGKHE
ncbi:MAG: hypothetical protein ACE5I8_06795, partial [Thermodesulfobacteriota bacterium]